MGREENNSDDDPLGGRSETGLLGVGFPMLRELRCMCTGLQQLLREGLKALREGARSARLFPPRQPPPETRNRPWQRDRAQPRARRPGEATVRTRCPQCGTPILRQDVTCPSCAKPVADRSDDA